MISFTGNLEYLPIVDIMQLLHQSRKSGILRVTGRKGESRLVFKDGYMVSANHLNNSIRIGRVLVDLGIISPEILEDFLQIQATAGASRKPLIVTLIDHGVVSEKDAYRGLEHLIELAVVEILTWKKGSFTFEILPASTSDFSFYPEKLIREINVDTQGVLMDALRIFDEKMRDGELNDEEPEDEAIANGACAAPPGEQQGRVAGRVGEPEIPPQRRASSPGGKRSSRTAPAFARPRNMICVCPACRHWMLGTEMFAICPQCGWRNPSLLPNRYIQRGCSAVGLVLLFYGLYGLASYYGNDWQAVLSENRPEPAPKIEVFFRFGFLPWLFTLFGGTFLLVVRRLMLLKASARKEMRVAAWAGVGVCAAYQTGEFVSWISIGNSPSFSYYATGLGGSLLMTGLLSLPFLALLWYLRAKGRVGG